MDLKEYIEATIRQALRPADLEVQESSQIHKSGVGYHSDGGRFLVKLVAQAFEGKKPVERERMVTRLFEKEIASNHIHVLRVMAKSPTEADLSTDHFSGLKG